MNSSIRIKTGDKIEIKDKTSQYFGKTGTVTDIKSRSLEMNCKLIIMHILYLQLTGINGIIEITSHPVALDSQIKILK